MPFLSSSILRRYTPPTCTLEIVAKDSPLSRWAGRPILRQLKFQLSLDDPRLSEAEQVTFKGDRDQLDELAEAVSAYVQDFLQQSPTLLSSAWRSPLSSSTTEEISDQGHDVASGAGSRTATLSLVNPGDRSDLAAESTELGELDAAPSQPAPLILQSPRVSLKPEGLLSHKLILGSLATVASGPHLILTSLQLSDLATALDEYLADAMSLPELNRVRALPSVPNWARTAAMLLLTAGVTAATVKLFDRPEPALQTAVSFTESQAANQQATANGQQTLGVPSPPLLSQQTLPPPPPAGAIASGKLPGVAVPGATANTPQISISQPSALPDPITIQPQEPSSSNQAPSVAIEQAPVAALVPPPPPQGTARQAPAPTEPIPPNAEADSAETAIAAARLAESQSPVSESSGAAGIAADSAKPTAFDSIPQVSEVRTYFQDRWQPPEGLTQTLEYTLLLSPSGSIQRIIPLGQSAGDYIDRTGMPLVGEPFVTPIQNGQSPRVRVVLSPDGQVRTFLESPN